MDARRRVKKHKKGKGGTKPTGQRVSRKIVSMLELPKDVVFNMPVIHALGDEDISVTNYRNLIEYSGECVRINTGSGQVRFEGAGLVLTRVTSESVSVSGRISKIEFQ